jgi:hypothetical protein
MELSGHSPCLGKWESYLITVPREKLRALGFDVETGGPPSPERFVEMHFSGDGRAEAEALLANLPARPEMAAPSIMSLYDETWRAILLGLHGAAIVMCGNLIEYVLKYAIYTCKAGGFARFDPDDWAPIETMTFDPAIRETFKLGLIDDDQRDILVEFKNTVRNPYSHHNIQKIVKGSVANQVQVMNMETGEVSEQNIDADKNLVIAAQVKPLVDQANVLRHFDLAHQVVHSVYETLLQRFPDASKS